MKYRFLCCNDTKANAKDKTEYLEVEDFPKGFAKYSSITLEKADNDESEYQKIAYIVIAYEGSPDVFVRTQEIEYLFKANIFKTLMRNGISWETLVKYSLRKKVVQE